jgi:hypothetical protein
MNTRSRPSRVSGRRETVGRHGTTRVDQARESRGFTSSTMYISSVLTIGVALDGCPVVAPIFSSSAWRLRPAHGIPTPASECPIMPEEQRHVAQWQRLTIYRYTLPPPYEATEHLFEELPLSTYPSGTTMEPLAYEMAPGAYLGRAAPWNQALVLFPRRAPPGMAGAHASGVSFREACDCGYLRPYAPQRGPDA